jgi:hypothetical protein
MRKITLFALAAVSVMASAGVNLNLNNPVETVNLPNSGSVNVVFTGTVDVLPGWDASSATLYFPFLGSNGLGGGFDSNFLTYLGGSNAGVDYSGNLFSITVNSTDAPGYYDFNSLSPTSTSQFVVGASKNGVSFSDNEYFAVDVQAVPEPASIAMLGIGSLALIRRRRRKNTSV